MLNIMPYHDGNQLDFMYSCMCTRSSPFSFVHLLRRSTEFSMRSWRTYRVQTSNCECLGKPKTITNLKEAIREEMRVIPWSLCKDVTVPGLA